MVTTISGYPFRRTPINNITPFTYRDGTTFLELISRLTEYLTNEIIPSVEEHSASIGESFDEIVLKVNDAFNGAVAELETNLENDRTVSREAYDKFTSDIDALIKTINNRVGPVEVQQIKLTAASTTLNVNSSWPTNQPVNFVVTQDVTGGRNLVPGANISGRLDISRSPNAVTHFSLIPKGAGQWMVYQPFSDAVEGVTDVSSSSLVDTAGSKLAASIASLIARAISTPNSASANAVGELVATRSRSVIAGDLSQTTTSISEAVRKAVNTKFQGVMSSWGEALRNQATRPAIWVSLGSSTADGGHTDGKFGLSWAGRIATYITGKPASTGVSLLGDGSGRPTSGVKFYNGAGPNLTSATYLTTAKVAHIGTLKPALVTHMVGSNDYYYGTTLTAYKNNLRGWIEQIRSVSPDTVHMLIHQQGRNDVSGAQFTWEQYGKAMQEVAGEFPNAVFLNADETFYVGGMSPNIMAEASHMDLNGHKIMADVVARAMGTAIPYAPQEVYTVSAVPIQDIAASGTGTWASITVPAAPYPRSLTANLHVYGYGYAAVGPGLNPPEIHMSAKYDDNSTLVRPILRIRVIGGGVSVSQTYTASPTYEVEAWRSVTISVLLQGGSGGIYMSGIDEYSEFQVLANVQ